MITIFFQIDTEFRVRQSAAYRSALKKKCNASECNMMVYDDGDEGRGSNDDDDDTMTMAKTVFGGVSLWTTIPYYCYNSDTPHNTGPTSHQKHTQNAPTSTNAQHNTTNAS